MILVQVSVGKQTINKLVKSKNDSIHDNCSYLNGVSDIYKKILRNNYTSRLRSSYAG